MLEEKEVIDKYEVTGALNEKDLYEVTDLRMRTKWVMKEISLECANNTNLQKDPEELIGKLEQMKKINHRVFPKVMEFIRKDENVYVIMEKVSGTVVRNVEKKKRNTKAIVNWTLQLCDAFEYMEQLGEKKLFLSWKHGMNDMWIEGGSVRLQDFEIISQSEEEKKENIRNMGEFICTMLSKKIKLDRKLVKIVSKCRNMENGFQEYKELADSLERYLLEQTKQKQWKKRGIIGIAMLLLVVLIGSAGFEKVLLGKTSGGSRDSPITPTKIVKVTQKPNRTHTPIPASKEPSASPVVTKEVKKKLEKKKKSRPTSIPKKKSTKKKLKQENIVKTEIPVLVTEQVTETEIPLPEPIYATEISLPKSITLELGSSMDVPVTYSPSNAEISISSGCSDIVEISGTKMKAKGKGTCTITVKSGNKSVICRVMVNE